MTMTIQRTGKTGYGVVEKAITPHQPGRIKYQGTYWKAELAYPECIQVEAGDPVRVVGIRGITQLVIPEDYAPSVQPQKMDSDLCNSRRLAFANWTQKFGSTLATALVSKATFTS